MADRPVPQRRLVLTTLLVLTAINFVNYLDRQVVFAVLEPMSIELGSSDSQSGLLATVFLVAYMVASPLVGPLGDRIPRKHITAASLTLWSLATVGSGLAPDYATMFATRVAVGIGEAGFAAVAPTVIADLFRPQERGRKLAIFYLATPMGSALGYLLGGAIAEAHGWRAAFFVAGGPGLVLALVSMLLPEPVRGAMDDTKSEAAGPTGPTTTMAAVRRLFRSPAWRINTVGTTLMTFTLGGLAAWMPTFLQRTHGLTVGEAGTGFGAVTVVAGLCGTLLGGWLGDRAQARSPGGYFHVSGVGLLLGAPLVAALPLMPTVGSTFALAFVAELLLFLNTGPLNAVMVGCVPASMRVQAVAVYVFFIHAFGDAISPPLMGLISERWNLALAVGSVAIPIVVGGVVLLWGARLVSRLSGGLMAVDD
ncbi:spinster family MFS transporter [Paraliomyxa miuraensis]|uniref:spinster family MFS transporter n=1 Tax=Paraliomyxa miuraensis TaxID=376150 RepID=UPI002258B19E|nr:MFS transporter [Paraliomyxa miuraensis]MCX4247283.1 MFS transporter [Paraliomyxa miuraensis]